jgi:hypothetical protein
VEELQAKIANIETILLRVCMTSSQLETIYLLHTQICSELQFSQLESEPHGQTPQTLDSSDLPISMVEALQMAQHDARAFMIAGGSIRRVGTDIVDFRHLDSEEIDDLVFAREMEELHNETVQTFMGPSSGAALVKKAIELKSAFTGKQIGLPKSNLSQPHVLNQFAVRLIYLTMLRYAQMCSARKLPDRLPPRHLPTPFQTLTCALPWSTYILTEANICILSFIGPHS